MECSDIGLVAIGRNEGERLHRCLASVSQIDARVYVDSGSDDGSVEWARAQGVDVVTLAVPPKFTAARARNAGIDRLDQRLPGLAYVQTIDGDCELAPGWLAAARAALEGDPSLGAVFGRLRERFPQRSIYNAMCDEEWDTPIGEAYGFGGIALLRLNAVRAVGGYDPSMIAAEDTDLARRMRDAGWKIARIDGDMAQHDADMTRFRQWWTRTRRSGHAFAELAQRHPQSAWPNWIRSCRSIIVWGLLIPVAAIAGMLGALTVARSMIGLTVAVGLLYAYKLWQIAASKRRHGRASTYAWPAAGFLMLGKVAQVLGMASYHRNRLFARDSQLIEYKGSRGR